MDYIIIVNVEIINPSKFNIALYINKKLIPNMCSLIIKDQNYKEYGLKWLELEAKNVIKCRRFFQISLKFYILFIPNDWPDFLLENRSIISAIFNSLSVVSTHQNWLGIQLYLYTRFS
jgi:hypothetical protein